MPAYSYTALDDLGAKHKGILSAESEREARRLVKDLKLTPLKISASNDLSKTLKIKNKDIVIMTRQLSTLLEANTLNERANLMKVMLEMGTFDEGVSNGKKH